MRSLANAEVRMHGKDLDEVCGPSAHMEHLDTGHWFVEIADVAVWLYSKSRITATFERREPGKFEQTQMEQLCAYGRQCCELLRVARCPNVGCDNKGTIAVQTSTDTWEPQECQWCSDRDAALPKNTQRQGADSPYVQSLAKADQTSTEACNNTTLSPSGGSVPCEPKPTHLAQSAPATTSPIRAGIDKPTLAELQEILRPKSQGQCETTLTERFDVGSCECPTYPDNLGPCLTWRESRASNHCVYCDHGLGCHRTLSARMFGTSTQKVTCACPPAISVCYRPSCPRGNYKKTPDAASELPGVRTEPEDPTGGLWSAALGLYNWLERSEHPTRIGIPDEVWVPFQEALFK